MRHMTVTRDDWLEARRDLLAAEKDLTRRSDQVAQLRRQLPWVRVDKNTSSRARRSAGARRSVRGPPPAPGAALHAHAGRGAGLPELLLHGRPHRRYDAHLAHRDVTFVAISRAPFAEIERYRRRMGWQFKWVSSNGSGFNYDFGVSFTPEEVAKGEIPYNYGTWPHPFEEWPGISVFCKDDAGEVFHTYSTYGRGVEG